MSLCFFLAALQIPHIGEGAPDWHTVKRPQIPVHSITDDSTPPAAPEQNPDGDGSPVCSAAHPPLALEISTVVCVAEPVYGWKYDCQSKQWVKTCLGTHAVSKYMKKTVIAYWIETIRCYGFYDDYGRLKAVPEYR
jgi:hypothetical protein